jgi:hypothetical protein
MRQVPLRSVPLGHEGTMMIPMQCAVARGRGPLERHLTRGILPGPSPAAPSSTAVDVVTKSDRTNPGAYTRKNTKKPKAFQLIRVFWTRVQLMRASVENAWPTWYCP